MTDNELLLQDRVEKIRQVIIKYGKTEKEIMSYVQNTAQEHQYGMLGSAQKNFYISLTVNGTQ